MLNDLKNVRPRDETRKLLTIEPQSIYHRHRSHFCWLSWLGFAQVPRVLASFFGRLRRRHVVGVTAILAGKPAPERALHHQTGGVLTDGCIFG